MTYLLKNEKVMKINVKHPTFQNFLDEIVNNIEKIVSLDNYFKINSESKIGIQYIVLKYISSSLNVKILNVEDDDIKKFVEILKNKSDDEETYELSSVLNDLTKNFDTLLEMSKPKDNKKTRKIKKEITD